MIGNEALAYVLMLWWQAAAAVLLIAFAINGLGDE